MSSNDPNHASVSGHIYIRDGARGPVWYCKYRDQDGQHKKALGHAWTKKGRPTAGYLTEKMAVEKLDEILADARRGLLERPTKVGVTFTEAAAEYLRYLGQEKQIDPKTIRDYRIVIDGKLIPEFGPRPLGKITADDIDAFKRRMLTEGEVSNRTIVRYLTVLHGIFKRAKRKYGLAANPASAELVERPRVTYTGEFTTYDREELELLFNAAPSDQERALYKVAAFSGLRQGELLALKWLDVDFVGGLLHVRRNYTDGTVKVPKGKKVRSVPMTDEVIDALGKLKERGYLTEDDDLVFSSPTGAHLDHYTLRRHFYTAIKGAELRRIRFHDLRHHFGTMAISVLDANAVQGYMGHAHFSTTARYLHHRPRREDAAKLNGAFGSKRGPERGPESADFAAQPTATENN